MLLAIDIGNTLTKFGFFENEKLVHRFASPTDRHQISEEISRQLQTEKFTAVIVSTVVPELKKLYSDFFRQNFNQEPVFALSDSDFDLTINYFPKENTGVDRLVAAFAALEKYGGDCIVCDFGTATTIDVVTANREFLGGIIAPGMQTMSESLYRKTAQLPQIRIEKPPRVIGTSTVEAIQSGIYFGYIGLVDGIIERISAELRVDLRVVATGGFAQLIAESSVNIDSIDENLLLEGLRVLYEKRFR